MTRSGSKHRGLLALGTAALLAALTTPATAGTNPPPAYTLFVPICYSSTNGSMRSVKPWGVTGASIPSCTPPSPWNNAGPYDATACNTGGSFDCRDHEYYDEIGQGTMGPQGATGPA